MPEEKQYTCGYCKETPVSKEHVDECRAKAVKTEEVCPEHGVVKGAVAALEWWDEYGARRRYCPQCVRDLVPNHLDELQVFEKEHEDNGKDKEDG